MRKARFYIIFILLLLAICSCKEQAIKKEISRIIGTKVEIPEGLQAMLYGKDTIVDFSNSDIKMVVLYKDMLCSVCQLSQMEEWVDFLDIAYASGNAFQILFIFSPLEDDIPKLYREMRISTFPYPIILDYNKSFISDNPEYPRDINYNIVLINSENRIIAVGNPLYNEQLKNLYISLIAKSVKTIPDNQSLVSGKIPD